MRRKMLSGETNFAGISVEKGSRRARRPQALIRDLLMAAAIGVVCASAAAGAAEPMHGYSPVHELKYGPQFQHFEYANPRAPKEGEIRLGATGTFDSLNPLLYPGQVPTTVRELVFDTLLVRSGDEPAAYYGLLAETVSLSEDRLSVNFKLRSQARWRDGTPVTAADVAFTFTTLLEQGSPFYRQALRHYRVNVISPREIMFATLSGEKRDMVRIIGALPIQPQHFWAKQDLSDHGMTPPLGSGPYHVGKVDPGQTVTLERDPGYWGADLPVNRGRFNFERITVAYYRDDRIALEAFRGGDFHLRIEATAANWASGYEGPALRAGDIRREVIPTRTAGEIVTLVFNLRRAPFDNLRVRQAISLAYDFDWTNEKLMHGLLQPAASFFGTTDFAARGPASPEERNLLAPFAGELPPRLFETPDPGLRSDIASRRDALSAADSLLREAGFTIKDGRRVSQESGEPLRIQLLNYDPSFIRIIGPFAQNLERLGITLNFPLLETATGVRRTLDHDYDMTILKWSPHTIPGNAESLLWGSALADQKGTYALAGAKDRVLDAALGAMVGAQDLDQLITATRTFDRVLRWRHYAIGLWRRSDIWLAYWDRFGRPESVPSHAPSFVDLWWSKAAAPQSRAGIQ